MVGSHGDMVGPDGDMISPVDSQDRLGAEGLGSSGVLALISGIRLLATRASGKCYYLHDRYCTFTPCLVRFVQGLSPPPRIQRAGMCHDYLVGLCSNIFPTSVLYN